MKKKGVRVQCAQTEKGKEAQKRKNDDGLNSPPVRLDPPVSSQCHFQLYLYSTFKTTKVD